MRMKYIKKNMEDYEIRKKEVIMKKLTKKELELLAWTLSATKICGSQTPDFRSYCLGYYSGGLFVLNLLNIDEELPERLPEIEELTAMLLFVGEKMIEAAFELYEKSVNKRGLG